MMAQLAQWRDDNSGLQLTQGTTSGTPPLCTHYTLTSNQGLPRTMTNGQYIRFMAHAGNATNADLQIDGQTPAGPLYASGAVTTPAVSAVRLPAGFLVPGCVYAATYFAGSTNGWVLNDIGNYLASPALSLAMAPIGTIVPFAGNTSPSANWLVAAGQQVSQATYATLYTVCGGAANWYGYNGSGYNTPGSGNFFVPDLRGRVPIALDNLGGTSPAGRVPGVYPTSGLGTDSGTIYGQSIGTTGGSSSHVQAIGEIHSHQHGVTQLAVAVSTWTALGGLGAGVLFSGGAADHTHALNNGVFATTSGAVWGYALGNGTTTALATGGSDAGAGYSISTIINSASAQVSGVAGCVTGNVDANGSSTAMAWLQPSLMVGALIRAL